MSAREATVSTGHVLLERGHPPRLAADRYAILLVVGVMDLRAMTVVTAAITAERLAPAGKRVARVIGAVAIGAGLSLIGRVVGLGTNSRW